MIARMIKALCYPRQASVSVDKTNHGHGNSRYHGQP